MTLRRVQKAVAFPVTIDAARETCKSSPEDDPLLDLYIAAANEKIVFMAGIVLAEEVWEITATNVRGALDLVLVPVAALISVQSGGGDLPGFTLVIDGDRATVSGPWPQGDVVVRFRVGGDVPDGLVLAMHFLIAHWYEHREAASETQLYEVPYAVESLVSEHRRGWVAA